MTPVTHTRRRVLAAAAALTSLTGCAGGEDSTVTKSPTDDPPKATATPTETPSPMATETETETEAQTAGTPSIRIWPMSVTTVFEGDVDSDAIYDALGDTPSPAQIYSRERDGETVTYFVSAAASFYVADATTAFGDADDLTVRRVYRGVGPRYRRTYESAIDEQAAERAGVDSVDVSLSPGRLGDHQYLDVAAPVDRSALVPMLPDLAFTRANGEERLVGPDGFALDAGFRVARSRSRAGIVTVNLTLDDSGVEAFTEAVEAASTETLREAFFRPVVDGEAFGTFGLSEGFVTGVENGDWDGTMALSFAARSGDGSAITRLTGLPAVPFDCEILD